MLDGMAEHRGRSGVIPHIEMTPAHYVREPGAISVFQALEHYQVFCSAL